MPLPSSPDARRQQPPQPAHPLDRQQRAPVGASLAGRARARRLYLDRSRRAVRQPHDQARHAAHPPAPLDRQPLARTTGGAPR